MRMKIEDLDRDDLEEMLNLSRGIELNGVGHVIPRDRYPQLVGSFVYGSDVWTENVVRAVAGRLGCGLVPLQTSNPARASLVDLLAEFDIASSSVDTALVSYVDRETFGGGQDMTAALAERSRVPLIGLQNEVYSHSSAMAHLSLIRERLSSLAGKRIAVCWTYGTSFVLPSTVHSVILLGSLVGANIQVLSPPEFQPLRRVVRQASSLSGRSIELETPDTLSQIKADAVIALNWSSLEALNDLERLRSLASPYRDWYLSKSVLGEDCLFLTEPPIQTEVAIDPDLLELPVNLSSNWLSRRVAVTLAMLSRVLTDDSRSALY